MNINPYIKIRGTSATLADLVSMSAGYIIWENANPTSTFASQEIEISGLSEYGWIEVIFRYSDSNNAYDILRVPYANADFKAEIGDYNHTLSGDYLAARRVSFNQSTNKVYIGDCVCYGLGAQSTSATSQNYCMIPQCIIGHRGSYFIRPV